MPSDEKQRPSAITPETGVGSGSGSEVEAEYTLETKARCPSCGQDLETVQVVRVLRTRVNFVSTLPRRGQLLVCGECKAILSGSLGGLL